MSRASMLAAALLGLAVLGPTPSARAGAPPSCRPDFVDAASYSMGYGSPSLEARDLNGDGFPDLVTTSNSPSAIFVRLGAPDGTFGPPIETDITEYLESSVVGTFTNDSVPDLVVSFYYAGDLELLVGNGDGTFQAPVPLGVPALYSPTAADMNGDGKVDLVGILYNDGSLAVLLGNGDGTFGAPIMTPVKAQLQAFAIGDIDGDGKLDLAASLYSQNTVSVLLGTGDGHFAPSINVIVGSGLGPIALADLNGDGHLDIAITAGDYAAVLLGNGDGTFLAARDYPAGRSPVSLLIGDFDADGQPDLAVFSEPNYSGTFGFFRILGGVGGGTFAQRSQYIVTTGARHAVIADFGNDGRLDLAATSDFTQAVSVFLGFGNGAFRAPPMTDLSGILSGFVAGDFNEDGLDDVVLDQNYALVSYLSVGDGALAAGPTLYVGGSSVYSVAVSDFDEDGHLDVALSFYSFNGAFVYLGNGDGSFRFGGAVSVPDSSYTQAVAAGDFDGDGHSDLAMSGNAELAVFRGRGDGTFDAASVSPADPDIVFLLAGDFNGDGLSDIAAAAESPAPGELSILLSQGGGTFAPPVTYATDTAPRVLAAGDFRHSGHLDLVVAGNPGYNLDFLPGQGDGTFGSPTTIALSHSTWGLSVADFDGDGNLDVVSAGFYSTLADFLYGLGDGTFQPPASYGIGSPYAVVTGDFDGNGFPDAAFGELDGYTGGIATLLNGRLGANVGDASALVGTPAVLQARAGGFGSLTYQWRRDGVPLSDGGAVSGVHTPTLTIDPAAFSDAASYDVLVTDSCGTLASTAGMLAVEFADVPVSNLFHADILTIATAGITAGCGGADYCPDTSVRRDQMAVFLLKSEHGSAYAPPACSGVFNDVACPGPYTDWVEQLAAEGVTSGCGTAIYCPASTVTRAQMAVFLLKTLLGQAYVPPAPAGIFADVPVGAFAAAFIEDLYNRNITGGCASNPLRYCPDNPVLRAPMATFLVRTFTP